MRSFTKKMALGTTVLCGLMLGGCLHHVPLDKLDQDKLKKVCETYCQQGTPGAEPGFAMMIKTLRVDDQPPVEVPMRNILARAENSEGDVTLVTPYDVTYGNHAGGDGPPIPNKTAGLKPECFAKAPYKPIHIDDLEMTNSNTTITLVNMDQDGRLESRDLSANDDNYTLIMNVLAPQTTTDLKPDAQEIQRLLSTMDRPTESNLQMQINSPVRDIEKFPPKKTPFFGDLTGAEFDTVKGHVFFYVLLDPNLYFSRDVAALITYAPEAENELEKLYTPFVQYPVVPELGSPVADPDGTQMEVLTFHFVQSDKMTFQSSVEYEKTPEEDQIECKYVYDKLVISRGQESFTQRTPLLIDPEVKTRGVIIE